MNVLNFYLASLIVLASSSSALVSFISYAISKRRTLLNLGVFLAAYAFEQLLIFQNEFLAQNTLFAGSFYTLEDPLLHLAIGIIMLQALWMAFCLFFDEKSKAMIVAPICVFTAISLATLVFADPSGATLKWAFYAARHLFMFWIVGYALLTYHASDSEALKMRSRKRGPIFAAFTLLSLAVLAEDTLVMLFIDPSAVQGSNLLQFLYRRNISEYALVLLITCYTVVKCMQVLRMKRDEPEPDASRQAETIDDVLPLFIKRHGLTPREGQILNLVLEGSDNTRISQELQLALGTVKTHVHNIFKKTGTSNRKQLVKLFWSES